MTISNVTVTARDGTEESQQSYALSYTLSNDTGERMGFIQQRVLTLLPDAKDPETLILLHDFPPAEEDDTSYAPPSFEVELLEPDEALSRTLDAVGTATRDPLLDLARMRVCVAFYRASSNAAADKPPTRPTRIRQSLAHDRREVACSPATTMPEVFSDWKSCSDQHPAVAVAKQGVTAVRPLCLWPAVQVSAGA